MASAPTVSRRAQMPERAIARSLRGLGLPRRAEFLRRAARLIVQRHGRADTPQRGGAREAPRSRALQERRYRRIRLERAAHIARLDDPARCHSPHWHPERRASGRRRRVAAASGGPSRGGPAPGSSIGPFGAARGLRLHGRSAVRFRSVWRVRSAWQSTGCPLARSRRSPERSRSLRSAQAAAVRSATCRPVIRGLRFWQP